MTKFENVQFCDGCPLVPEGITAVAKDISYTDMAEYRNLAITRDIPGFVEEYVDTSIKITSTVIESMRQGVDVGDQAVTRVERYEQTEEDVANAIRSCEGPKRNLIARALGQKGVCQAVTTK